MNKLRWTAGALAGLMSVGLAGCGGGNINAAPRRDTLAPNSQRMPDRVPQREGMSTGKKVLLLAGAAAVYYMYQKHKNAQGEGVNGRYYRSKNGRVYYRDMKTGAFQWVDPPTQPISVPADEFQRYTGRSADRFQGTDVIRDAPQGW
jgi:hypothetical protein